MTCTPAANPGTRSLRTRVRRGVVCAVAVVALVPALAGCWQGFNAATNNVGTGGNGVEATSGPVSISAATIVLGPERSGSATLTGTLINAGPGGDALVGARLGDTPGWISGQGPLELPPRTPIQLGHNSNVYVNFYDVDLEPSTYVELTLLFRAAGALKLQVLTVPPTGQYSSIAPVPVRSPAAVSSPAAVTSSARPTPAAARS
ncbi:MAG: hypothetical protein EPO13_02980 [Actinomycetota bacterium]|nr:MAG: hypothetical protein EPO13_02980 [Actinomycetota bacterium]